MAALLGTDQSYYSKYERGVHPMTAVQIKKLAVFFNVSADYLLGIIDTPDPIF
ncbi:MAG: helix-turn-helix transcriptional regulator [Clostridia bacterium]|nr:helix-turn-helix transcriptional regulator [Clostridia bacterium]